MRRTLLALAVLASVFITLGVGAGTASAAGANCNFTAAPIAFSNGYLVQTFSAHNCTDVDWIEYSAWNPTAVNMVDASTGGTHHIASVPPTLVEVLCGRAGILYTGTCNHTIQVLPWCPPMTPHVVYGADIARIHRKSTNTTGPWNWFFAPNQSIWC